MDVFGDALFDYQRGSYSEDIVTYSSLGEEDVMLLPHLFRDFQAMPVLEQKALNLCKGTVLDVGCGAGSHSLYLQNKGFDVTALDVSKGAIETCRLRGLEKCIYSDIMNFEDGQFDTVLLLMNGIGLAGKLKTLGKFLAHLNKLLAPNGQIILDSSDIIYMFDDDGGRGLPTGAEYYGEVTFTIGYKGEQSEPFSWLYIDQNTMQQAAIINNFNCEIVSLGEHFDYLARLTRSS